jgi:hypothetical protein
MVKVENEINAVERSETAFILRKKVITFNH